MSNWSQEEDQKLARMWLRDGATQLEIAADLEKSKSAVTRRLAKHKLIGQKGNVGMWQEMTGKEASPLIVPVRYEVPPLLPAKTSSIDMVSLHWTDVHYPMQDDRAVNILYQVGNDVQPNKLFCLGDLADFWQISNHRPREEKKLDADQIELQDTLDMCAEHLGIMRTLGPIEEAHYFYGNHEDRWERMLAEVADRPRTRHLLRIPKISQALSLDYLFGLDELGWESHAYKDEAVYVLNDRLVLMHGYKSTVWVTRTILNDYGKSGMFGHDHRIQNFTKRDLHGTDSAWGIGCLCDLNVPYMHFPNWHQGFAVVTWKQINGSWFFNVEQVRIHDGKAIFRGKSYTG